MFFIDFYVPNLLFVDGVPIPFNGNLLYCPILLDENNCNRVEENGEKIYIGVCPLYIN